MAVMACLILTPMQIRYWRNSRVLFTRAAAVTDQYFLAYYNIGCYAMEQGDYGEAIYDYKKALSSEPDNTLWSNHSRAYNDLGFAYLHEGQISNAVANLEKALNLQPSYPQAYYNLGRAFLTNRQPEVAVDCFQRALALDQNPIVMGALATAYAGTGQLSEAVAAVQRARQLALAQNNPELAAGLESQLRIYQNRVGGLHP
jgi:tetratricopeptide (TPR) repeat protein